jgi:Uma2 family endonuclease
MMDIQHGMLPSMATRARGTATAADIVDDRHEVIRGELVPKEAAGYEHGSTQGLLFSALRPFHGHGGRPGRPGGWWLGTEIEIELETHDVYVPDISGWRIDRVPEPPSGKPIRITPDWVCEVLSPSTMRRDRGLKQHTYRGAGIGHYWLVDPINAIIWVYRWSPEGYTLLVTVDAADVPGGELVRVEPFDAIGIDPADVFTR